jgi:dTDP-glucose 4,6-dehydratase
VEDHCKAIEHVLEAGTPGEVYNIGGNNEKTNLEVVHTLCDLLDELRPNAAHQPHRSLITYVSDRPGHDLRYALNGDKIADTGWKAPISLEQSLKRTVEWNLAHPEWLAI